jgi:hypothetical protein
MATWAIVALVLGSNIIIAFATFFTTKYQVSHSGIRFEKELNRQREIDARNRRWEVRSEPLLKLRDELAIMASELDILVATGQAQNKQNFTEGSERDIAAQKIYDKWEEYRTSGDFLKTLHLQCDVELLKAIDDIKSKYLSLFEYAIEYKQLEPDERISFRALRAEINNDIPLVQELINKRLEGL